MDVTQVLLEAGGIAGTASLLRVLPRHELRAAHAAGTVVRLGRGRYGLPGGDQQAAVAAGLNGALTLASAALAHGWPVKLPPEQPQVVVPRGRNVPPARRSGAEVRWGEVTSGELARGVTDPVRTALDCARLLPLDAALAVVDSALRVGIPRTDLLLECARLPRTGRARAYRVVELGSAAAANPFESVLRAVLVDLPDAHFVPQQWVAGIGRPDLVDRVNRVVVEADSFEFHSSPLAMARDMERYNAFVCEGYVVLRFAWRHAMFEQDYVRATVAAVLAPQGRSVRPGRQHHPLQTR